MALFHILTSCFKILYFSTFERTLSTSIINLKCCPAFKNNCSYILGKIVALKPLNKQCFLKIKILIANKVILVYFLKFNLQLFCFKNYYLTHTYNLEIFFSEVTAAVGKLITSFILYT